MKSRKDFWVPWFIGWCVVLGIIGGASTLCYFLCTNPDCHHGLKLVKILISTFVVATIIISAICNIDDYRVYNELDDVSVKMKFNHFKDAYYVNPDRWTLRHHRLYYERKWNHYKIVFSYLDWLKFLVWCNVDEYYGHLKLKRAKQEEHNIRMAEMLKCIQMDINEAYEKIKDITT